LDLGTMNTNQMKAAFQGTPLGSEKGKLPAGRSRSPVSQCAVSRRAMGQ
jgi:hypothetical protein